AVDIDASPSEAGRSVSPQIVGSAARDRHRPSVGSEGPAGRAAKLSHAPTDDDDEPDAKTWWLRARAWLLPLAVLVGLLLALWGGYAWSQTQYFVGANGDYVAIYRGIP